MDPKRVAEIQQRMSQAINMLNSEYVALMHRMGVKRLTFYQF